MAAERQGDEVDRLADAIRTCRLCRDAPLFLPGLPDEPRPILRVNAHARILIASQAPGIRAHLSGVPFDDPSGDRLRAWMGLDRDSFFGDGVLIVPMGFCFPGHTADKGDLPPRRECAGVWHERLFAALPQVRLMLLIGRYSQAYHFRRFGRPLPAGQKQGDLIRAWRDHLGGSPRTFVLPHPSWRNSAWLKRNPWFDAEVLPELRREIAEAMATGSSPVGCGPPAGRRAAAAGASATSGAAGTRRGGG